MAILKNRVRYYKALKNLRTRAKCAFPVQVKINRHLKNSHGHCSLRSRSNDEKYFSIVIRFNIEDIMIDSLIHEWAHAYSWSYIHENDDSEFVRHDESWGIAYAKCYRIANDITE